MIESTEANYTTGFNSTAGRTLMKRDSSSTSDRQVTDIRMRIQGWLMEFDYTVKQTASSEAHWTLIAEHPTGGIIAMRLLKGKPDHLIAEGRIQVSDSHQSQFMMLPSSDRQKLFWALRFRLLSMGVDFSPIQEPFEYIGFSLRLFYIGLNKDAFYKSIQLIQKAKQAAGWIIRERFDEPLGEEESNRYSGVLH